VPPQYRDVGSGFKFRGGVTTGGKVGRLAGAVTKETQAEGLWPCLPRVGR